MVKTEPIKWVCDVPIAIEIMLHKDEDSGETYLFNETYYPVNHAECKFGSDEEITPPGWIDAWDSCCYFVEGGLRIVGADGPGGGDNREVIVFVPQNMIRSILIRENKDD